MRLSCIPRIREHECARIRAMIDTCVVLLNMGGPRNGDEVRPFLKSMFADPDLIQMPLKGVLAPLIVALRTPSARKRYDQLPGGSPLLEITTQQALRLEQALNSTDANRYKVFVGMRYTSPSIADAFDEIRNSGCRSVIGLSMYPQYCRATTGSSIAELERVADRGKHPYRVRIVDRYFDHAGYLEALTATARAAIDDCQKEPFVLFSAHGVPQRMVAEGDPYVSETEQTVSGVVDRLGLSPERYQLAYQSRVGPVRWVGPSSESVIGELKARGVNELVIVPVSFTAENLETLYDMDIVLSRAAREAGVGHVRRAAALNADHNFIDALAILVREAENR